MIREIISRFALPIIVEVAGRVTINSRFEILLKENSRQLLLLTREIKEKPQLKYISNVMQGFVQIHNYYYVNEKKINAKIFRQAAREMKIK